MRADKLRYHVVWLINNEVTLAHKKIVAINSSKERTNYILWRYAFENCYPISILYAAKHLYKQSIAKQIVALPISQFVSNN